MAPSISKSGSCCLCGKTKINNPEIRLHLFPSDPKRRMQWLQRIKIPYEKESQAICQDHFDDRYRASKGRLLPHAVPHLIDGLEDAQIHHDVDSVKVSPEDLDTLTKDVGTDALDGTSFNTTVKLPQYDCFGTEFGVLPNPFEIEDPHSQSQGELPVPLSPQPEQLDDVSKDPLSASPLPSTTVNLFRIDAAKDETTEPPRKMMRHLYRHFSDTEILVVVQGVEKRKDFILGNVDDKNARAMKDLAWKEVANEVNAISRVHRTTDEVIRKFYELRGNLKKRIPIIPQNTEGNGDVEPISQGIWTKWEKVLLRLPTPVIKTKGTAGGNLPSTSGTVKRYGRASSSPLRDSEEFRPSNSHVFSDSDSDSNHSLPPTYAAAGNSAVIVIDGEKHEVKIFDAPAEGDLSIRTQESTSGVSSTSTAGGTTSHRHRQRNNRGNYALVPEFLRAQDEMRDLLEELIQAQQESTAATERAAAAIRQSAEAQMVSAQAIRSSATALTTLATSMKSWLQRHPQRR